MTTLYLIRHGEVHNPDGIIYGRLPNFGLSEKGKKQIEKTAEYLEDKQIDFLYSSPLQRARETAEIIKNKLGISTIHTSEELLEVKTSYQGGKFLNLDKLQSEVYLKPLDPTDETIPQIAHRMKDFIDHLVKTHAGKTIVLVSHGDPIMALKAIVKNNPLDFFVVKTDHYIQHGEVYELTVDDNRFSIKDVFKPIV